MIEYLGYNAKISNNVDEIIDSSHLILPGVGSFDRGMNGIIDNKLFDIQSYL